MEMEIEFEIDAVKFTLHQILQDENLLLTFRYTPINSDDVLPYMNYEYVSNELLRLIIIGEIL